ncbi:MAG: hypothetical protein CL536_02705 [Alcaligenaceae bacterium]|nr:hypothetical protein [Alcaligenaceae bacterium]
MSRSPDYDTPVEQMDGNALIENALAMQKAAVFEMDRDELMAENVRLGASQFTPETCLGCGGAIIPDGIPSLSFIPENGLCNKELAECHDEFTYVFMCLDSGIPAIVHMTDDEQEMRRVWIEHLEGDTTRPLCDEKEWSIEEGFDRGYFVNHKTEYRILVHRKEVEN